MSGTVPTEIGLLSTAEELYLGINRFDGQIPSEMGNLLMLEYLDMREYRDVASKGTSSD